MFFEPVVSKQQDSDSEGLGLWTSLQISILSVGTLTVVDTGLLHRSLCECFLTYHVCMITFPSYRTLCLSSLRLSNNVRAFVSNLIYTNF